MPEIIDLDASANSYVPYLPDNVIRIVNQVGQQQYRIIRDGYYYIFCSDDPLFQEIAARQQAPIAMPYSKRSSSQEEASHPYNKMRPSWGVGFKFGFGLFFWRRLEGRNRPIF